MSQNKYDIYALVLWPESQEYMDEPWFDDHAILADVDQLGESQAYFIPIDKVKQARNTAFRIIPDE